ncbi:radical SAM protein [Candidatus Daviesbacteria bacterium]|nr:radical SAM protein [Candidatus Daviesbacteria bacterium]
MFGEKDSEEVLFPYRKIYYQLKEGIYFVPGVKGTAICDTTTGNVYSINEAGKRALLGQQEEPDYLQQLKELGLVDGQPQPIELQKPKFALDFVWFELTEDCNERCAHCYANSMPPRLRRLLPMAQTTGYETNGRVKLTAERWRELIRESYDLGCRECQFIGGEPFFWHGENKETMLDLATYAKGMGYLSIEIFTNATLIHPEDIQRIKELDLHIAVSLYSDDEEVHDTITKTPGSFARTTQALERLKEAGVQTRVETVLMRPNQHTVESTNQFIQQMGFNHRSPDVLRPKGRGDNLELIPDPESLVKYGLILGPDFSASPDFFQRSVDGHNCLAGKITITDNGNVLPCIFSREQIVGNVRQKSLEEVLEDKIQQIWGLTKDDVLVCQDCQYRYVCFDCRPLSEGATSGNGKYASAPYPRCTHNPYEDRWGNGTWKLDGNGQPYYDETLKPIIEKVRSEGR